MDIRCGSCSKLFRVADEKIAGKGIRFKCSRCGEVITITRDDFERDKLSRETAGAAPVAPPPSRPVPLQEAEPQASREPVPQDFQPREYQPPPAPPAGIDDFDFSETNQAAAASSGQEQDAGLGGDFSFGDQAEPEGQEAAPEISISPEEQQEAEKAAFAFPTDLVSEPERALPFSQPAAEPAPVKTPPPAAPAEPVAPAPAKERPSAALFPQVSPSAAAAAAPAPLSSVEPPTATTAADDDDIDLGAALAIPKTAGRSEIPTEPPAEEEEEPQATETVERRPQDGSIHPLASGTATGAVAGIGCAVPIVLLLTLSFSVVTKFLPMLTALPVYHLIAVAGVGILGLSIMIGLLIAVLEAQTGRRQFFLVNILIGTLFGALFGAGMSAVVSFAASGALDLAALQRDAVRWGATAFFASCLVVIARRIMVFSKEESFGTAMTGLQKIGLTLAVLVILGALYGEGMLSARLETPGRIPAGQPEPASMPAVITPDGLTVVNATGYLEPEHGDLVITGSIRNSTDKPKQGWYLETAVYDAAEQVLATVRAVNGVQLFSARDRDVLTKRGVDVDQLRDSLVRTAQAAVIPPGGSVNFEVRLYGPPAGSAGFLPVLKRLDTGAAGAAAGQGR